MTHTTPIGSAATVYGRFGKRVLDVAVAGTALVFLSPLMLVLAVAIVSRMGRPVLFSELRAGQHGRAFLLRKFRTMTPDTGNKRLTDEERLTPLGRVLRQASLDELPELVHVLRGEMSLVGPRPLPVRYLDRYTPEEAKRLDAKPGLTGLAQVRGRNALGWEEKFTADLEYLQRQSFWLDAKLLCATVLVVLTREGVSQSGHATMEEFRGTR